MKYKFICTKCGKIEEREIPMKDYDKEKNNQLCSKCPYTMQRIIEWQGIASGKGDGWFGKSNGSKSI